MKKPRVIFLCTGNSARSQMGEAFLRTYAADRFDAYSAGLEARAIHPFTTQVMEEVGISLDGQYSKPVGEYLGKLYFGYLFTVCDYMEQHCPRTFLSMGKHEHWVLEDPEAVVGSDEEKLAVFRQVRDQIDGRVREWLATMTATL